MICQTQNLSARGNLGIVGAAVQEMDFTERSMYPYIEKLRSIEEAVKKFGRR